MPTPTVRRLQLGNELRHLRHRAGRTLEEAAKIIDRTHTVMSKLENGSTGIRLNDLVALVNYYADLIDDDGDEVDLDWYLELNKGAANRGRWSGHRSTYPKWFRMAVDLETDASAMNVYQTELVHGLLQTENYMRAMFTEASMREADEITDNMVQARLARQHILDKKEPPELAFVLSESTLRRVIGNSEVMREQLVHLARLAERPNIQIHVLPFRCRTAAGVANSFVLVRVPSAGRNSPPLDFVHVEQYANAYYFDSPVDVSDYTQHWNRLLGAALERRESQELILRTAEQYL